MKRIFLLACLALFGACGYAEGLGFSKVRDALWEAEKELKAQRYAESWTWTQLGFDIIEQKGYDRDSALIWHMSLVNFRGALLDNLGNHVGATEEFLKGLQMAQSKNGLEAYQIQFCANLGISYKSLKDYEMSHYYLNEASSLIREDKALMIQIETIKASLFIEEKRLDSAAAHLQIARDLGVTQGMTEGANASWHYWMSRLHEERFEYQEARKALEHTLEYDRAKEDFRNLLNDRVQLAVIYEKAEMLDSSQIHFQEILVESRKVGTLPITEMCLEKLYKGALEGGDSLHALRLLVELHTVSDSLNTLNRLDKIKNVKVRSALELLELERKTAAEKLVLERDKKRLALGLMGLGIVIVLGLIYFIFLSLRNRIREKLSYKEKELVLYFTEIASKSQTISKTIQELKGQVKNVDEGQRAELNQLVRNLEMEVRNRDFWKEFEVRFRDVHTEFYQRLNGRHPELTQNEIRLCAFLKLNFSTKEIAAITKKTVNSINVAKHRIKNKLQVPPGQTLPNYLNGL